MEKVNGETLISLTAADVPLSKVYNSQELKWNSSVANSSGLYVCVGDLFYPSLDKQKRKQCLLRSIGMAKKCVCVCRARNTTHYATIRLNDCTNSFFSLTTNESLLLSLGKTTYAISTCSLCQAQPSATNASHIVHYVSHTRS